METNDLRKKVITYVNEADEDVLLVVNEVLENYKISKEYELPEIAEKLILQAIKESKQGMVKPHDEVMAKYKKKDIIK